MIILNFNFGLKVARKADRNECIFWCVSTVFNASNLLLFAIK